MNNIYILSGPVQTGKTTHLMQWASSQKNIDGIFQPIIDEKRFMYHIASRTLKLLEVPITSPKEKIITIGNYTFSKDVFEWSQNILLEVIKKDLDWLIVDEVGPLEIDGTGLEPAITNTIRERNNFRGKILFVVRESLLNKFVSHYKLKSDYSLFNFSDLR